MNAPTRHLVALVIAGNLMGCQLIKKFTDRNRDSGTVAPTGTTVVTLDGGMVVPVVAYDAAMWGDAAGAMAAAMANAADAQAMAAQAMANAQNALADAGVPAAPGMAPGVAPAADPTAAPAAPPPVAAADPAAAPAAPPPVAAADPAPAAPPPAADPAPAAPVAAPADERHHRSSGSDFCRRHPGEFNQRTGQICPNALGSHNLGR